MIKKFILLMFFSSIFAQYFEVTINQTGESHLVIHLSSVTGLDVGDEVGVFDLNGVLETVDNGENPEYGEVLVGAGIWNAEQLEISAIMSIDLSDFNGPILNGAIDGNAVVVKVYDTSEDVILDTELTIDNGGEFGDFFTVISELEIIQSQAPEEFAFNASTMQAFYFIIDANIDGDSLEIGQDYIAAFNGDICVGNIVWEGAYTTVPAMGYDGEDYSEGYLSNGDVPTFKIYDASENSIIDGCPDTDANLGFSNLEFIYIDMLVGNQSCTVSYDIPMHYGANLVSFHALPEDVSIGNVMESLGDAVTGVIGEGVAASPNPALGWVGSLSEIERTSGYWIKLEDVVSMEITDATPSDPALLYNMHYGANLISFPIPGSVGVGDGIPDDVEEFFTGVIGEGVAASPNPELGWVGSLSEFEGTKGYWAKVDDGFEFSYDLSNASSDRVSTNEEVDIPYEFTQSTQQAFYFIEKIDAEINNGDWILAYNDGVLVGSRQWRGIYTDIPAMGYDDISTSGYCEIGDIPQFIWIDSDGKAHLLTGDIPAWSNNEIYNILLELDSDSLLPSEYNLIQNYPNPFNPSTTISFTVPSEGHVIISVFDLNGRLVSTLLDQSIDAGYHSIHWDGVDSNGLNVSAGLYIYTLQADGISLSSKMILMK